MAATTNNYGFPYPQDSDTVDVAGDIQSLAEDIDTKLSEAIADTVGTMVTSNTESGITVTYDDADNTLDFDVADFTLTFLGDVSGSASITNLASASATITIAPNSVALGTDTTGNYIATVAGTNNEIEVSGSGSESATITIGLPDNVTISNDLTVTGNLIVSGSTAYINTTELLVEDNLVTLNSGTTGAPSLNAGIEIERGTSANTDIRWNESLDVWQFTNDGTNYYTIKDFDTALATKTTDNLTQGSTNLYFTDERAQDAISTAIAAGTQTNITVSYNDSTNSFSFVSVDPGVTSLAGTADEVTVSASAGAVTLSLPATINANTTGTAAALTTARTIALTGDVTGSVSFDGSSSASIVTTVVNGGGGGVTSLAGTADEVTVSASAGAVTLSLPATINANTTGTAAALTTARTIELTGDVTGTVSFDGSSSASIATTIAANSVALGTDTTGNYVATASAGTGIEVSGSGSETAALTITNTGVTSLAGTADEVTVSASAGAVTLSLPSTISQNKITNLTSDLSAKAPIASPTFTGVPAAPTASVDTNTTQVATTAYVVGQDYLKSSSASTTYATLASPTLTGVPAAPTATLGTNTTQIATTAFVKAETAALVDSAPATLDTLNELAAALGDDANFATTVTNTLANKLDISSASSTYLTQTSASTIYAPLASPTLTGIPTAPTASVDTNTTQVATTAYVVGQDYLKSSSASTTYAALASPTLTGTPAAPTAAAGTNTTQLATTAFVQNSANTLVIDTKTDSYTLLLTDAGETIEMNSASANTVTIPLNSSVAFAIGTTLDIIQYGAGQTTIVATGGVTLRSKGAALKLTGQYSGATLYKRGTDEWVVVGDLTV